MTKGRTKGMTKPENAGGAPSPRPAPSRQDAGLHPGAGRGKAAAFAKGTVRPREFGGGSSTADIVRATLDGL